MLVANASQQTALIGLMTYFAAYIIESYGWGEGRRTLPLALLGVGAVIGSLAGGMIAGRRRRLDWVALVGLGGGVVVGLIFALQAPLWAAIALSFGASMLLSVSMPVLSTVIMELAGGSRATASGMYGTSNQLGGVLGASAGGLMLSLGGFPAVGRFCLAAAVMAAAVVGLKVQDSAEFRRGMSLQENWP